MLLHVTDDDRVFKALADPTRRSPRTGEPVHVTTDPGRVHVFDSGTGERLSA